MCLFVCYKLLRMTVLKNISFYLQDLTQEKKSEIDRQIWVAWLEKYKERLKEEEEAVTDVDTASRERVESMNSVNPRFDYR